MFSRCLRRHRETDPPCGYCDGCALDREEPEQPRYTYERFWREVTSDGRALCALDMVSVCDGPLDAHHFIPKRRIKAILGKDTPECQRALLDSRNGVALCRRHHDQVEAGRLKSPRPPQLPYFISDHGVSEYRRAAAPKESPNL